MAMLAEDVNTQLKQPSIIGEQTSLYMQRPPSLEKALRKNLVSEGSGWFCVVLFVGFSCFSARRS
jgi:hypothetical protein